MDVGRDPVEVRIGGLLDAASYSPEGRVLGTPLITPALYDANKCIAMTNSVVSSAPRALVSDRFHILPSTSFGSRAFSNICFATTPESSPFSAPDFSNNSEYSLIFSGARGGTRIGGGPACVGLVGGPVVWVATGGIDCPSNRGRGPAVRNRSNYGILDVLEQECYLAWQALPRAVDQLGHGL